MSLAYTGGLPSAGRTVTVRKQQGVNRADASHVGQQPGLGPITQIEDDARRGCLEQKTGGTFAAET